MACGEDDGVDDIDDEDDGFNDVIDEELGDVMERMKMISEMMKLFNTRKMK